MCTSAVEHGQGCSLPKVHHALLRDFSTGKTFRHGDSRVLLFERWGQSDLITPSGCLSPLVPQPSHTYLQCSLTCPTGALSGDLPHNSFSSRPLESSSRAPPDNKLQPIFTLPLLQSHLHHFAGRQSPLFILPILYQYECMYRCQQPHLHPYAVSASTVNACMWPATQPPLCQHCCLCKGMHGLWQPHTHKHPVSYLHQQQCDHLKKCYSAAPTDILPQLTCTPCCTATAASMYEQAQIPLPLPQ